MNTATPPPPPRHAVTFRRAAGAGGLDVLVNGQPAGFISGRRELWLHVYDPSDNNRPAAFARIKAKAVGWKSMLDEARALCRCLLGHLTPAELLTETRRRGAPPPTTLAQRYGFDPFNGAYPVDPDVIQ